MEFWKCLRVSGFLPKDVLLIGDRQDKDGTAASIAGIQFLGVGERQRMR
jgi:FMN phosphatase YigB (HAD superfamily)